MAAKSKEGITLGVARPLVTDDFMSISRLQRRVGYIEGGALVDPSKFVPEVDIPKAPTSLILSTQVSAEKEGEAGRSQVTATWVAPVLNTIETPLTDLLGFNISWSTNGTLWNALPGIPTVRHDVLTTTIYGLTPGTTCMVRVSAVDSGGNESAYATTSTTTAAIVSPTQVTGLSLTAMPSAGVLQSVWAAISNASLYGYEVQWQASSNVYPAAATFAAWAATSSANSAMVPLRPGVAPSFQFTPPDFTRWYKLRVRAVLFGGTNGAWSADSTAVNVDISLNPSKILDGTLDPTKAIMLGYADPTHKVVITGGGIAGYFGSATPGFSLDGTGLTLRSASIYIENGVIRLQGTADTAGMFLNNAGLKCTAAGVTKLAFDQYGLVVTGAGTDRVYVGRMADDSTFGLEVVGNASKIVGARVMYGKTVYDTTTTGYWLGVDSLDANKPKFVIGTAAKYLSWNGTDLKIVGGTIEGTKFTTDATDGQYISIGDGSYGNGVIAFHAPGSANYGCVAGRGGDGWDEGVLVLKPPSNTIETFTPRIFLWGASATNQSNGIQLNHNTGASYADLRVDNSAITAASSQSSSGDSIFGNLSLTQNGLDIRRSIGGVDITTEVALNVVGGIAPTYMAGHASGKTGSLSIAAGATREYTITFPVGRFASAPNVVASICNSVSDSYSAGVISITSTGCIVGITNRDSVSRTPQAAWIATLL